MPRKVSLRVGSKMVVLPNGEVYDGPADEQADPVEVTLSDAEFARIKSSAFGGDEPLLTDGGDVPITTQAAGG